MEGPVEPGHSAPIISYILFVTQVMCRRKQCCASFHILYIASLNETVMYRNVIPMTFSRHGWNNTGSLVTLYIACM